MNPTANCRCGRQWTGTTQAHCPACHEHFSTAENFDLHRKGLRGRCGDPRTMTRERRDGSVVPLFRETENAFGTVWVGWSRDPRYTPEGVAA
ncbi:hypothetical protein [Amycolatopsis sacchari]|uniref:FDXHR family putative zinc-binding protein n=1 Tax=Amycolatopsis sacchari TaxID=115433 RepID=UPI003D755AEE